MAISIHTKPVDLYSIKVHDKLNETLAIYEIQGQIKHWLKENKEKYPLSEITTLLINKLVYYSMLSISDTVNSELKISSGWYKYGPCFEVMRDKEMDLVNYYISETRNYCVDEIAKVCEEEIPIYLVATKKDLKTENRFFYTYLKHIYEDKNVYPELGGYYPNKHELAHLALSAAYNPEKIKAREISKAVLSFNREINKGTYSEFVGLDTKTIEDTHAFTIALEQTLIVNKEKSSPGSTENRVATLAKELAHSFDDIPLMIFAYKNYIRTFEDVDKKEEVQKKEAFSGEVIRYLTRTQNLNDYTLSIMERNESLFLR